MQTITELVTESTGNSKKFDQGSCALSRKRFVLPALNRVFKSRPITPFPPGIILCSTRASAFKVVWCRAAYFCGHYDGYLGEGGGRKKKKEDICCGKTFLPSSNSLALMKSWDRERGGERAVRRASVARPSCCGCLSHALLVAAVCCYLTQLREDFCAEKIRGRHGHRGEREREMLGLYTHRPDVRHPESAAFSASNITRASI